MAAGKSLNVKLRYRARSLQSASTGLPSDPTEQGADIKNLAMSPPLAASSDASLATQAVFDDHIEPLSIATALDHDMPPMDPSSIPPPPMIPITTADILSQRRRRKSTSALKRTTSTPNFRGHHNSDPGTTLAEKRRNKLGYHRTSIACSHCRRRKIRCLAAADDPYNRCATCIRLKKECNFFPVDQQPPIERRPRPQSKADPKDSDSSQSSPRLAPGPMLRAPEHYNPYHDVAVTQQGYAPPTTAWSNGISPMTRVDHRSSYDFSQPPQQQTHWHSPFADPGPMSAGHSSPGDASHGYWSRHTDSPLTPAYSPHLPAPTSTMNNPPDGRNNFNSFGHSRADNHWPLPGRSMSIGVVDDIPASYHNNVYHPQPLSLEFRRRNSEMHPPSLITSANSSHASISESGMTPMSAPVASPPTNWGVPSAWNALPSSAVTKPTDFGTWYSEPSLAKVQEEEVPPPYGEQPVIVYPDAEPR